MSEAAQAVVFCMPFLVIPGILVTVGLVLARCNRGVIRK